MTTGTFKVAIKFWQIKHRSENFQIKQSQYFGNFAKTVKRSYNKTLFQEVFKILAEFDKVFNFEKFLIYVLSKFN